MKRKEPLTLEDIKNLDGEDLVYVDESGMDAALMRPYGRSQRGDKILCDVSGKRGQRISIIAAYGAKKLKAPLRFEGYTDTTVFNHWVKTCLVPVLKPGQTVIIDNASFHKSADTERMIQKCGCSLKFLPTYSPDLNPIEQQWAILKARIRKHRAPEQSLTDSLDTQLKNMCIGGF
jgi:transposase